MNETIPSGFQSLSERVFQYHSYIVALFSGIVIGFLTNYLVTYVFPLPYWQGLSLSLALLALSVYLFLLYFPEASRGKTEETVPQTLHEFLHANFDKLLCYIKLDWEGYAFHKKAVSADGWMAPVSGVKVKTKQRSSHQGEIELSYPFLRVLKCKVKLDVFVTTLTEVPEYRKVIVGIQMNSLAKLHPRSDLVLRTLGIRLHHAITNPQIVYPEMPDEEYHKILKESDLQFGKLMLRILKNSNSGVPFFSFIPQVLSKQ
jgi:hypothetical protein